jgi:hypothetical protein
VDGPLGYECNEQCIFNELRGQGRASEYTMEPMGQLAPLKLPRLTLSQFSKQEAGKPGVPKSGEVLGSTA